MPWLAAVFIALNNKRINDPLQIKQILIIWISIVVIMLFCDGVLIWSLIFNTPRGIIKP